jgi:hypothetical protein
MPNPIPFPIGNNNENKPKSSAANERRVHQGDVAPPAKQMFESTQAGPRREIEWHNPALRTRRLLVRFHDRHGTAPSVRLRFARYWPPCIGVGLGARPLTSRPKTEEREQARERSEDFENRYHGFSTFVTCSRSGGVRQMPMQT